MLTDYKAANIERYDNASQKGKFSVHPSKIIKMEEFKRRCRKLVQKNEKVLDIGGGVGVWTDILREEQITNNVFAVDISESALKERNPQDICSVGDMENLPYADNFFDRALFFASLHHVKDTKRALAEAYRILKTEGHILLIEPISLRLLISGKDIQSTPDGVEFSFSLPYLLNNLRQNGFKKEYIYFGGFLKRLFMKVGIRTLRLTSRVEETINKIPLLRTILGVFGDYVIIVAQKT